MMNSRMIGLFLLVMVFVFTFAYKSFISNKPHDLILKGYVGGEKIGLLEDKDIKKVLKNKYGITFNYSKAGSIEMVEGNTDGQDFLFPSSQTALELYKETKSDRLTKSAIIFNTPIVFYSWKDVTEALIKQGIVTKKDSQYYIVDMPKLIKLILDKKKWSDIGLSSLYGNVVAVSTDPTKSNSGNMFFGLLANIMNNKDIVDNDSIQNVLPKLKEFYKRAGYMETSSSDLFDNYLRRGMGDKPLIVGYENQIIEFAQQNKADWEQVKDDVRILYPEPTVWSAHPYIAITPSGTRAIAALSDPDIQKLAWEKHGFRTQVAGVKNDIKAVNIAGIPEKIMQTIGVPQPAVMKTIIDYLGGSTVSRSAGNADAGGDIKNNKEITR